MRIKLLFFGLIQVLGVECMIYLSHRRLDYLDAVMYCSKLNSTLSKLTDAVTARNHCMLNSENVWYAWEDGDPDHQKKDGMCYVYGKYWKPCRDKYLFFCDDKRNNQASTKRIDCDPSKTFDGLLRDIDSEFQTDHEEARHRRDTLMRFNMYEWMVLAGVGTCCFLLATILSVCVMKWKYKRAKALEEKYMSMGPTRLGPKMSAIDSKWYEETLGGIDEGPIPYEKISELAKTDQLQTDKHVYAESTPKIKRNIQQEPPHVYDRVDKVTKQNMKDSKGKSRTLPVNPANRTTNSHWISTTDATSNMPPVLYERLDVPVFSRSLSVPPVAYESTRESLPHEVHLYQSTPANGQTDQKYMEENVSHDVHQYESTHGQTEKDMRCPPYESIYKQWVNEEKRITMGN